MLFLEPWFWIFAAVALPVYWACPSRLKIYWLLITSVLFHYHFAGPAGMVPIIVLATLTYLTGLAIGDGVARWTFAVVCTLVVGALAFYKYSGFLAANVTSAFATSQASAPDWLMHWRSPAAPLAISFFTFEFIHYLFELRVRGRAPIRNPVHFAVFAIFFPSLACGPIKRFPDFVPQLSQLHTPAVGTIWAGVRRVIRGLFKKVCIADLLVECIRVLETLPHFPAPVVATLAVLQGFRIYYDFCGYSDIAIGMAQTMGLRIPENFDRPFLATSLREFWRRWHMSLSSWIRDYVYIPLGGSRTRQTLNVLVTMVLFGLWHGAAWSFVLFGIYHGAGLAIEAGLRRLRPGLLGDGWLQRIAGWALCYSFVTYGWLIFFYPIPQAYDMTREALAWCCAF